MFEKLNEIAEQAATSASRREFLGRLGKGALTVAAAVGGALAWTSEARAGHRRAHCCFYRCHWGQGDQGISHHLCHADGSACVASFALRRSGRYVQVCRLRSESQVRNCDRCGS